MSPRIATGSHNITTKTKLETHERGRQSFTSRSIAFMAPHIGVDDHAERETERVGEKEGASMRRSRSRTTVAAGHEEGRRRRNIGEYWESL